MTAQEVQVPLDFRPDVEQLKALETFSHTPLGQEVSVRRNLALSTSALLELIRLRAEKQTDLLKTMRTGLQAVLGDGGAK